MEGVSRRKGVSIFCMMDNAAGGRVKKGEDG